MTAAARPPTRPAPRGPLAVVVDLGGSSVKAGVAVLTTAGPVAVATASVPTVTSRPAPGRAEFDPAAWEAAAGEAVRTAVARAEQEHGVDPTRCAGLVVCSLRQGFVLSDGERTLGSGVLNSDRRGETHLAAVAGLYATTGHWPAPELTLPKLLHVRDAEPQRWAATRRLLYVADWLVARWTGTARTEVSYACAGGMADVAARAWATDLLADLGIDPSLLPPLAEAGDVVGRLARPVAAGLGLPAGLPVHAGCGDTQVAAVGAGGLADGVVTVVAGSSTPVQAATAAPLLDPLEHPWVSTHAARDRWAVETNAGYPGSWSGWARALLGDPTRDVESRDGEETPPSPPGARGLVAVTAAPEWSAEAWAVKPPVTLLGLRPEHHAADVRRAFDEAHAFGVRGNVEDLERVLGRPARELRVVGGAGARALAPLLADVLGRPVHVPDVPDGAVATLGAAALVAGGEAPTVAARAVTPQVGPDPYAEPYARWREAHRVLRTALPDRT